MSSEILDQQQYAQPTRNGLPAWALSVVMHALAFLLLGLLVRNVSQGPQGLEEGRPVSIVLAQQESGGEDIEFIDGDSENDTSQAEAGGATEAQDAVLPPGELSDASDIFPDIALPGAALGGGGQDASLTPKLSVNPSTKILPGDGDADIIAAEAARRAAAGGPQGPPTSVSLFGSSPAVGHSFVFVIDRSKSMGSRGLNALAAAEKELISALEKLERNHKFEIIAYHNRPVYFSQKYFNRKKLVPATPENKARVADFFGGLAPLGYTEHGMAVKTALYLEPDVIYLMTDGGEPGMTDHEMARVNRLAGGRTTIHCIQFGSGKKRYGAFMARLARENRGGYGYVDMSGARP